MRARRILSVAALLAVASVSAWAQLTITPATLPAAGGAYLVNQAIAAQQLSAGTLPSDNLQWSVSAGVPPGITFNTVQGAFSGTPTVPGVYVFTVSVIDFSLEPSQ